MHRIRLIGLALIAAVALGALVATAAMAEKPEFSPSEKNAFTSLGGKTKFEQKGGIAPVGAEKSTGSGEMNNAKEGKFTEVYENDTAPLSGKCTGLSDTKVGSITASGTTKLGYLDTAKTKVGVVYKLTIPVHYECEKTVTLVTVEGAMIGEITPLNKSTKEFKVAWTETKGVNTFTKILNATNTAFEEFILKSEMNGGATTQSGQEATATITTSKAASIVA
jgi:hypothetical protein